MKKKKFESILNTALQEKPLLSGFPILDECLNGFWKELYILSGASSMGKTSFITQLCWNFVQKNKDCEILFFSLDHPGTDISLKIACQSTESPFSHFKNLKNNNTRYDRKLKRKLKTLKNLYRNISIFDSSRKKDFNFEQIQNLIEKKRKFSPESKLVVVIDQLYSLIDKDISLMIEKIKKMCRYYDLTVILSMSLPGEAETAKPRRKHFCTFPDVFSKSYVFFSIYTDFILNYETPFLEWDWQHNNTLVPITELYVQKNKIESFTGSIFYKFYNEISMFKECLKPEIENYKKMDENLAYSAKKKKKKK
ncbi:MAG: DnaB-like helicase C-terminal domain-containing protein [Candidatus Muiribacteriota bacterium]